MGFALVPKPRRRIDQAERAREREHQQSAAAEVDRLERLLSAAAADRPEAESAGLGDGVRSDASTDRPQSDQEGSDPEADAAGGEQHDNRFFVSGLTKRGALMLEDFCAVTREDGSNYGFWTVTLSPAMGAALDRTPRGLARFQDVLRRRFGELLTRRCRKASQQYRRPIRPHWAFVVEPQKRGVPHWHFVYRCRARRGRPWLLTIQQLDTLIAAAMEAVTGEAFDVTRAGNAAVLKRDPGAYLSKYLRKGALEGAAAAVLRAGYSANMLPGQWWGVAECSRQLVLSLTFELPSVLVGWLSLQWPRLVGVGALTAGIYQPPVEGAPAVITGRWHGISGLEQVVESLCANWWHSYDQARIPSSC